MLTSAAVSLLAMLAGNSEVASLAVRSSLFAGAVVDVAASGKVLVLGLRDSIEFALFDTDVAENGLPVRSVVKGLPILLISEAFLQLS